IKPFKLHIIHPDNFYAVCINNLFIKDVPDNQEVCFAIVIVLQKITVNLCGNDSLIEYIQVIPWKIEKPLLPLDNKGRHLWERLSLNHDNVPYLAEFLDFWVKYRFFQYIADKEFTKKGHVFNP